MVLVALCWVCAFEKLDISSSLYRLALAGNGLHQLAYPKILGELSGRVCRWAWCLSQWVRGTGFWIHKSWPGICVHRAGLVPASTVVGLALESVGVGLEPQCLGAAVALESTRAGLLPGSTGVGLVLGTKKAGMVSRSIGMGLMLEWVLSLSSWELVWCLDP